MFHEFDTCNAWHIASLLPRYVTRALNASVANFFHYETVTDAWKEQVKEDDKQCFRILQFLFTLFYRPLTRSCWPFSLLTQWPCQHLLSDSLHVLATTIFSLLITCVPPSRWKSTRTFQQLVHDQHKCVLPLPSVDAMVALTNITSKNGKKLQTLLFSGIWTFQSIAQFTLLFDVATPGVDILQCESESFLKSSVCRQFDAYNSNPLIPLRPSKVGVALLRFSIYFYFIFNTIPLKAKIEWLCVKRTTCKCLHSNNEIPSGTRWQASQNINLWIIPKTVKTLFKLILIL